MAGVARRNTYLNQVLALRLGDQGLELGRREGVDESRLRHDKKENLGAGEDRKLVSLRGSRVSMPIQSVTMD